MIEDADRVLMGAGAGMSAAAGAQYGGRFFEEHFGDFIAKYGGPYMRDMYSAGFYPYPDEESKWGYWSKQALLAGADQDVPPDGPGAGGLQDTVSHGPQMPRLRRPHGDEPAERPIFCAG
ncbi:MAG: hypothetical protein NC079_11340 [Clostridium sp.]|nr:hypothetical protein [Acetatifactor muris]MCM1528125.1 hypothetical protein [Bacteroides sp.]MCM1564184.1 hypothetical protein [Clostridium sp.]